MRGENNGTVSAHGVNKQPPKEIPDTESAADQELLEKMGLTESRTKELTPEEMYQIAREQLGDDMMPWEEFKEVYEVLTFNSPNNTSLCPTIKPQDVASEMRHTIDIGMAAASELMNDYYDVAKDIIIQEKKNRSISTTR